MDAWTSTPVLTCRSCGTELPSDAGFCWNCGTSTNPATSAPAPGFYESSVELDGQSAAKELHRLIDHAMQHRETAFAHDIPAIEKALERYPDAANVPYGPERRTALHKAARGDPALERKDAPSAVVLARLALIKALLTLPNIDVNPRDGAGNTPLHHAIACCPELPYGIDRYDSDILDPFMLSGQYNVITDLLKLGADPDAVNKAGQAPIHLAAERGRHQVVVQLISVYGGNPLILDRQGWTAVHYATRFRYPLVRELVEEELENRRNAGKPAPLPEPIKLPGEE